MTDRGGSERLGLGQLAKFHWPQAIWTAVWASALYWGIHEDVRVIRANAEAEAKARLVAESTINQRITDIYNQDAEDKRQMRAELISLNNADAETRRQIIDILRRTR